MTDWREEWPDSTSIPERLAIEREEEAKGSLGRGGQPDLLLAAIEKLERENKLYYLLLWAIYSRTNGVDPYHGFYADLGRVFNVSPDKMRYLTSCAVRRLRAILKKSLATEPTRERRSQ